MSPVAQPTTKSAFTLAESLTHADQLLRAHSDFDAELYENSRSLIAEFDRAELMLRFADSRFNPTALSIDDMRDIDNIAKTVPLFAMRSTFGPVIVNFVTERWRDGFRAEVEKTIHEKYRESDPGENVYLGWKYFEPVTNEGLLHAIVHHDEEVRRCAKCSKWFAGAYKARNRFCSDNCRRRFAALGNADKSATFTCAIGEHTAKLSAFAGLAFRNSGESSESKEGGRLAIAGFMLNGDHQACAPCVMREYPEWESYVAPVMLAIDRVEASV